VQALRSSNRFPRIVAAVWLAICLWTAVSTYGYYHEDEFGQITAFSLRKLGILEDSQMPWEYERMARPWLQPAVNAVLYRPLIARFGRNFLVLDRAAFLLNLLLVVTATWAFAELVVRKHGPPEGEIPRLGLIAVVGIWFLPSMMIRHSAEAMAAALLVLAFWCWRGDRAGRILAAGLLAGFAFWVRFQTGFFLTGFAVALTAKRDWRHRAPHCTLAVAGFLLACAAGIVVDYWGYGTATLTPLNYFVTNIIEGAASGFGTQPWYWYPLATSAVCLNPLLWFWIGRAFRNRWRDPLDGPVIVGVAVFVIAHSLVPHKELRFLLPVLPLAMLVLLQDLRGRRLSAYYGIVAVANLAAFLVFAAIGMKGPRNQAEYSLWKLGPPTTVYSATDLFHRFDGGFQAVPPEGRPDGRFRKPAGVRYVYSSPHSFAEACRAEPAAYVLITNSQIGLDPAEGPWIDRRFESPVSQFPPPWIPSVLTDRVHTWRHKLVPCSELVRATGPTIN